MNTYKVVNGTSYSENTPDEVIRVLENCRANNTRVHLTLGHTDTGRAWLEENDVDGTIGRSCGSVKVPILLHNRRCIGGGSILDSCIVRIVTTTKPRRVLYQHPQFSMADLVKTPGDMAEYPYNVNADGLLHARFRTEAAADRWLARMI